MKLQTIFGLLILLISCSAWGTEQTPIQILSGLQSGSQIALTLKSSDAVIGTFQGLDEKGENLTLLHETWGPLLIPVDSIVSVKTFDPVQQEISKPEIKDKTKPKIWENKIEAGVKGSEGNTVDFSLRAGAEIKRTTESNRLVLSGIYNLDYNKNKDTNSREKTGNRFAADGRSEWPFQSIPRLFYFISSTYQYDEFKEFEHLIAGHTGLGYDFIKREHLLFSGHVGAGVSQEFGGPTDADLSPEAVAGLNLDWDPTDMQKLTASTEIFPNLRDTGEFRMINKIAWALFFTKSKKFNVSLGVDHRYDSLSGTSKPNDLDYYASLVWLF